MKVFCKKKILMMLVIFAMAAIGLTNESLAVARKLEYDFTVNDSWTYTVDIDNAWAIHSESKSGTVAVDCDLILTVDNDNGGGSFDIAASQVDGTMSVDGETPVAMNNGFDTYTQNEGRGKTTHELDMDLVLPDFEIDKWNIGSMSDQTGPFSLAAVDVDDTWTQTYYVTPYGESQQTVTVNCTLLEWTTLNGYNVAKIQRTATWPKHWVNKDNSEVYIDGDANVTEYWWFSYDQNVLVKSQNTSADTLTFCMGTEAATYLLDTNEVSIQTLQ